MDSGNSAARLASSAWVMPDRFVNCDGEEAPWWRWRESNPRPQTTIQDFSGRSWLVVLLGPYALTSTS
jgi:hypothetical protein